MEEFNTYEYSVEHSKRDKKLKRKRFLLILVYITYCMTGLAFVAFSSGIGVLMAPLMALIPVTLWMIVFFTWRYVSPEYRYSLTSGVATFTVVYGGKTEKKLFELRISSADVIEPKSEELDSRIKEFAPEIEYNCVSSIASPDVYCILFTDKDGKRVVCRFEATARALKILKYYNSRTLVSNVRY